MWRITLALILIPTILRAQDQALSPKTAPPVKPKPLPRTESYTRFNALRRGTTEEVGVVLFAHGFLMSPRSKTHGIAPVSLEFDPEAGLNVENLRYPKSSFDRVVAGSPGKVAVNSGGWFPVEFKLRADPMATLGSHLVHGKFTYQTITDAGMALPPEQIDVVVPVTVVEHHARVAKSADWPFYHMSTLAIVGLVALCVVLLPLLILLLPLFIWGGWWD